VKSVVLVEVKGPDQPAHLEPIALTAGRALRDVRGTLDELEALASACGDAYLRVFVRMDQPLPGLADEVRKRLPNAIQVHLDSGGQPGVDTVHRERRLAAGLDPVKLYADYHRLRHHAEPEPELLALFRELASQAAAEEEA
jgi:exonuclease SbcD